MSADIRNILVPTDFSEPAMKAIHFAANLAVAFRCKLTLYHAIGIPYLTSPEELEMSTTIDLERIESEQLYHLRNQLALEFKDITIEAQTSTGFTVEEIRSLARDGRIDLVVMGTRGASSFRELLMGSNTSSLVQQTECPVLAIPENTLFQGINKIVFACNLIKDDVQSLIRLIEMFKNVNPEITLLHVHDGHTVHAEKEMENWMQNTVRPTVKYNKLNAITVIDTDIVKSLHNYLSENPTDLLVTATRKRNFFEKIFDPSISRKLIFHTHIPLLVLHKHGSKGEMIF
ncbi:universal stress protein [soil metagenome]